MAASLTDPTYKRYRTGTHRSRAPSETIEHVGRLAGALGITRVANVTGLDCIGIPVVMVCRPNSRSITVTQGKGATLDAAKASGLMESVETFHAERISSPLRLASYEEMRYRLRVADVTALQRTQGSKFDAHTRTLWIESRDLLGGEPAWLPLELVSLDLTRGDLPGGGSFVQSSNGLASGNTWSEAVTHGVCEVLERDAFFRFKSLDAAGRGLRRVRLETVNDDTCESILERFESAGISVAAWDTTGRSGVPSFFCSMVGREGCGHHPESGVQLGMGCHPDRGVALSRALTEAAQSRLTMIAGARDDLWRPMFARAADRGAIELERNEIECVKGIRAFTDVPTCGTDDLQGDVELVVQRAAAAGFPEVLLVDHSIPEFGLSVVHIVIPGSLGFAPS